MSYSPTVQTANRLSVPHPRVGNRTFLLSAVLWVQSLYYLATGLWPILSIETFQMVTGRKTDHLVTGRESDHWLVMTVSVLVLAIGLTLLVTAWRGRCPVEVAILAIASAAVLTGIDVIYVTRNVIPPIYLV